MIADSRPFENLQLLRIEKDAYTRVVRRTQCWFPPIWISDFGLDDWVQINWDRHTVYAW